MTPKGHRTVTIAGSSSTGLFWNALGFIAAMRMDLPGKSDPVPRHGFGLRRFKF